METIERRTFTLVELKRLADCGESTVEFCIRERWIEPSFEPASEVETWDEEDLARVRLIHDLRARFGANDESIPLILDLLDQLYYLRSRLSRSGIADPGSADAAGRTSER